MPLRLAPAAVAAIGAAVVAAGGLAPAMAAPVTVAAAPTTVVPPVADSTVPGLPGVDAAVGASARDLLAGLVVMSELPVGFSSSAFPAMSSKAGRCAIRERAVIKAALPARGAKKVRVADCRARDAQWRAKYVGKRLVLRSWSKVGADLLVPTREAWQSGAFGWTQEQRDAYARNLRDRRTHLVSAKKQITIRKSREPQEWLPPDGCGYAIDWIVVKHTWQLSIDAAEHAALAGALATCPIRAAKPLADVAAPVAVPSAEVPPSTELIGRTIGPEMFGLNVSPRYGLPTVSYGAMRLWDADTSWADIQPAPGTYDWDILDEAVADAQRTGVRVVLVLGGTPGWAAASPGVDAPTTASSPPRDPAEYEAFVAAVVDRYAGRIFAYQAWNEANLSTYWRGTPEQMADLTARVHRVVKARDPGALVVAASTTIRLTSSLGAFYPEYLAGLASRGWPVDALSVHSYPASTGGSAERDQGLALYRVLVRNSGAPPLPVWETEINFGLAGPGPTFPDQDYTGEQQQALVVKAYLDSLRNALASTMWYRWDVAERDLLGVQMVTGSAASAAYTAMVNALVGSVFTGCVDGDGLATCSFTAPGGAAFRIVWATSGSVSVPVAPQTTVCPIPGSCAPASTVTVGAAPVILR